MAQTQSHPDDAVPHFGKRAGRVQHICTVLVITAFHDHTASLNRSNVGQVDKAPQLSLF